MEIIKLLYEKITVLEENRIKEQKNYLFEVKAISTLKRMGKDQVL